MRGYPDRAEAERLVREAESRNPGPWGMKRYFEEKTGTNIYDIVK